MSQIDNTIQQKKLARLYKQLGDIGSDDGIIGLRRFELNRQRDAQMAFASVQSEAASLKQAVDSLVDEQGEIAKQHSLHAEKQIRMGQGLLIVLAFAAVIGAALIAWLYVGRNIAQRLSQLSSAMRRLADGDLNIYIQDNHKDEIAEMARALQFFRQATADVVSSRQNEIEQTRMSEVLGGNRSRPQRKVLSLQYRAS